VTSSPDIESAYKFHLECKRIIADSGMNLRKWHSNSQKLLERINSNTQDTDLRCIPAPCQLVEEDDSYAKTVIGPNVSTPSQGLTKVLGVLWNSVFDVFTFEVGGLVEYANSLVVNRHSVLKLSAKIFNPLGLISPFVLQLKILFQTLCVQGVNWDEPSTGELLTRWRSILPEFSCLNSIQVPRCYFRVGNQCLSTHLHRFCDACDQAYAAVVYLRIVYSDGSIH